MKKYKKNLFLRFIRLIFLGVFIIAVILGVKIYPTFYAYYNDAKECVYKSTADTFHPNESSYIYDSKGDVIAKLQNSTDSSYLSYEEIPEDVRNAFIAVEDRTFWENPGVDVKGIARVLYNYARTKGVEKHGASTITQQLAKNIFLTQDVTMERKLREIFIAYFLNKKYSKEQIMEFYVNDIYYGNSYYGIEAASVGYFDKPINELSLSQMTYLCAIPNQPSYYDPVKHPDNAIERRNLILSNMLELGFITQKDYDDAVKEEIKINQPSYGFDNYAASYAIDCSAKYLMQLKGFKFEYQWVTMDEYNAYEDDFYEKYSEAVSDLYRNGYHIYTTINVDKQNEIQEILDNDLAFDENLQDNGIYDLQGAITVIDNKTGKVIALCGGRSQDELSAYSLNRAYQSYRQPGSTIKPIAVYTPALEKGYNPSSYVKNIDVKTAIEKYEQDYTYDVERLRGKTIAMRSALEQSLNGVAWYLFNKNGIQYGLDYLVAMQFENLPPCDYNAAAALGGLTYGTTTVEMASAYATLENHGVYRQPTCLKSILTSAGEEIYADNKEKKVYEEESADNMVDMMKGVLTKGTAKGLKWYSSTETEAACKTGTTNSSKDGWLCGFTPYYTVSVWVGYDNPKELSNLYGATYPGTIWKDTMLSLIEEKKAAKFKLDIDDKLAKENDEGY